MINLADLVKDQRKLTVKTEAGELNVTYRPSAFTAATEERYVDQIEHKRVNMAYVDALVEILDEWDLVDDAQPVSLDRETLSTLPSAFLADIFWSIVTDNRQGGKETRKNSGDGSPPVGKRANARRGGRR
jgi:hypothetical protein